MNHLVSIQIKENDSTDSISIKMDMLLVACFYEASNKIQVLKEYGPNLGISAIHAFSAALKSGFFRFAKAIIDAGFFKMTPWIKGVNLFDPDDDYSVRQIAGLYLQKKTERLRMHCFKKQIIH